MRPWAEVPPNRSLTGAVLYEASRGVRQKGQDIPQPDAAQRLGYTCGKIHRMELLNRSDLRPGTRARASTGSDRSPVIDECEPADCGRTLVNGKERQISRCVHVFSPEQL